MKNWYFLIISRFRTFVIRRSIIDDNIDDNIKVIELEVLDRNPERDALDDQYVVNTTLKTLNISDNIDGLRAP